MTPSPPLRIPDYAGGSLPNLVAELEQRLTGTSRFAPLHPHLARLIPPASTYILLMIDGLGALGPGTGLPATAQKGTLDAPFPTTTTVGLATVATGLPPAGHGILGHQMLLKGYPRPVNLLRWVDSTGKKVPPNLSILPRPNLWDRLAEAGIEPIAVQPQSYANSPFTKVMYQGCRFEGVEGPSDFSQAVVDLARPRRRLIFAYFPEVDVAAHTKGFDSDDYRKAVSQIVDTWETLSALLPSHARLVGTSDHGLVKITPDHKFRIKKHSYRGLDLFGDPRALYVRGPAEEIARLGRRLPAVWYPFEDIRPWWGPIGREPEIEWLIPPDGVFLADPDRVLLPGHMDRRMVGYHGGLDPREVGIPLLVGDPR